MTASDSDSTREVQIIINQIKHDDTQVRVQAMGKLKKVADVLGVDRTKSELIPFLKGSFSFIFKRKLLFV